MGALLCHRPGEDLVFSVDADPEPVPHRRVLRDRAAASCRATELDRPRPWENLTFWFFAQLGEPPIVSHGQRRDEDTGRPGDTFLVAADGSWCEVAQRRDTNGRRTVWEAGPRSLWATIETAHDRWMDLGEPRWERFGLTVTSHRHIIWLDRPDSPHQWPLAG